MAIDRSWRSAAVVGGVLLGLLSMFWLSRSLQLMVDNATCCLWTGEGDGRRGIVYAAFAGSFQVATLVLAIEVIRQRALRSALAVVVSYVAVTVILIRAGGGGEGQLWVNLVALVVAALAIVAALLAVTWARGSNH